MINNKLSIKNDEYIYSRLGIGPSKEEEERNTEEEVNDYLARAIDARSIDRLRSEHCTRFFLSFRDKEIEVNGFLFKMIAALPV